MDLGGNKVLITGGGTGIGFALAESFLRAGSEVFVCGRREEKLGEAKERLPGLRTFRCDVSRQDGRDLLLAEVEAHFPGINVLVNNAGIQRMIDLKEGLSALDGEDEVAVNLVAPIRLSVMFIPLLLQKESAVINVSSGLGFVPMAIAPVYCATKAAVHSFTLSLRHQLRGTPIKVFEVIPPIVDTALDRGTRAKRGQQNMGIPPSSLAKEIMLALEKDQFEIPVGMAKGLRSATGEQFDQIFKRMNG